jgi:hypothetical protein
LLLKNRRIETHHHDFRSQPVAMSYSYMIQTFMCEKYLEVKVWEDPLFLVFVIGLSKPNTRKSGDDF